MYILDADWVDAKEKVAAAKAFIEFIQTPASQKKVLEFGFRPGNPDVAVGAPITKANGVDPEQPATLLQVPEPPVMISLLEKWREQRKGARVLLVLDVSGFHEGTGRQGRPQRSHQAGPGPAGGHRVARRVQGR